MRQEHAMHTRPRSTVRRLRRNHFLHFKAGQALCLRAERGSLWVTVDGLIEDIELDPGHSRVFEAGANIIVGTFDGNAVFSATAVAEPRRWHQRLRAWLAPAALLGAA
jgi:hypothetical protein